MNVGIAHFAHVYELAYFGPRTEKEKETVCRYVTNLIEVMSCHDLLQEPTHVHALESLQKITQNQDYLKISSSFGT